MASLCDDWWLSARRCSQFIPLLPCATCCAAPTPQRLNDSSRATRPSWATSSLKPPAEPPAGSCAGSAVALAPPEDSNHAFERFDELGAPRGVHLNLNKSATLSTLGPAKPTTRPALNQVLSKLKPSNHLQNGVVYLGTPIGNSDCVTTALTEAALRLGVKRKATQSQLEDLQAQTALFAKCLLPSTPHLLATDALLHFPSLHDDFDPCSWSSPFLTRLQPSTAAFLARAAGRGVTEVSLDAHAWNTAHFPASSGGLGFQDFAARAVASFVAPLAGAARRSLEGFPARSSEPALRPPPALAASLSAWSAATNQQAVAFRFLAPRLLSLEATQGAAGPARGLVSARALRALLRDLTRARKKRQRATFSNSASPFLASALPPVAQRRASEALLSAPRRLADLRLPSPCFRLMISRNLRLPVIEPGILCACGHAIDARGDHCFQRKKRGKVKSSSRARDCSRFLIAEAGQRAGLISSKRDALTEPVSLAQHNPTSRPADALINLAPARADPPAAPLSRVATDVAITPPAPLTDGDDPSTCAVSAISHHQKHERKKFGGRSASAGASRALGEQVTAALNNSSAILLPFTIDPHGGIGPLASRFLLGAAPDPPPAPLTFRRRAPRQARSSAASASSPSAALLRADKSWRQNSAHLPFGATRHAWLPSTWARQILGASISAAFSEHLRSCAHRPKLSKPRSATCTCPLAIGRHTRPYIQPTTQQRHDRSRVGTTHNPDDAF